MLKRTV